VILWGIFEGIRAIFTACGKVKWGVRLATVMVVTIAIANSALLAVDAWVARSPDFYSKYEGGLDASLISNVRYLTEERGDLDDGELAVSEVYNNLGKRRISKFGLRATVMLSNHVVRNVPGKFGDDVNKAKFNTWARSKKIRWYLYQQPISPWRVWHFRLPASVQKALSREEVGPPSAGWVLYRYNAPVNVVMPVPTPHVVTVLPAKWIPVEVEPVSNWPTRVPGL
jgi:hypothetical protein